VNFIMVMIGLVVISEVFKKLEYRVLYRSEQTNPGI